MKSHIKEWIQNQAPLLDHVIATTAEQYFNKLIGNNHATGLFGIDRAMQESLKLSNGCDLSYDLLATPFVYSVWYHARRVNTCLRVLDDALYEAGSNIVVYDLGAGTGAWQWAFGLYAMAMKAHGDVTPEIHFVNIDSSPFMLDYLNLLWEGLCGELPGCREIDYKVYLESWTNEIPGAYETWLCASYLFDHSDKHEKLSTDFDNLVGAYLPRRVLLSTSTGKSTLLKAVSRDLINEKFSSKDLHNEFVLRGKLPKTSELRSRLQNSHKVWLNGNSATTWEESYFTGVHFTNDEPALDLEGGGLSSKRPLHMYQLPSHERIKIRLTTDQQRAARYKPRPTHLYGPAGCGKTVCDDGAPQESIVTEGIRPITTDSCDNLQQGTPWTG